MVESINSLSRRRERAGVRVDRKEYPLTFILSPWGEEIRTCPLSNSKQSTFNL
jgi:hypothetical protein